MRSLHLARALLLAPFDTAEQVLMPKQQELFSLGCLVWLCVHVLSNLFFIGSNVAVLLRVQFQLVFLLSYLFSRTKYMRVAAILFVVCGSVYPYLTLCHNLSCRWLMVKSHWSIVPVGLFASVSPTTTVLPVLAAHAILQVILLFCDGFECVFTLFGLLLVYQSHDVSHDILLLANKTKERFTSNISHELRTPLNGVIASLDQLIEKTPLNSNQQQLVNIALASGENLLQVVNEFLDYADLQNPSFQVCSFPVHLNKTLAAAIQPFTHPAAASDIKIHLDIDASVPEYIITDPQRLTQIVGNFLSNAIKFSPRYGMVSITVFTTMDAGRKMVKIQVEDRGSGIEKERAAMLFQPFTQLDINTPGIGLGLAISKALSRFLGGKCGVSSAGVGEGSTFWLLLPQENAFNANKNGNTSSNNSSNINSQPFTVEPLSKRLLNSWNHHHRVNSESLGLIRRTRKSRFIPESDQTDPESISQAATIINSEISSELTALNISRQTSWSARAQTAASEDGSESCLSSSTSIREEDSETEHPSSSTVSSTVSSTISSSNNSQSYSNNSNHLPTSLSIASSSTTQRFESNSNGNPESPSRRFVLVAEDNLFNQQVTSMMLESMGLVPVICNNGQECIDALTEDRSSYALILMDCQMPIMDGHTATTVIRTLEQANGCAPIPIVGLTADAAQSNIKKCMDVGMNQVLTKPVRKPDLQHALSSWLSVEP